MAYPLQWTLNELGPKPGTAAFPEALEQVRNTFQKFRDQAQLAIEKSAEVEAASLRALIDLFSEGRAEWTQLQALAECYVAADAAADANRQAVGAVGAVQPDLEKSEHLLDQLLTQIPADSLANWLDESPLNEVAEFVRVRLDEAHIQLPDSLANFAADINVDGLHAWGRLYDDLSSDVRIPVMEKGEVVEKSPGQVSFDSADRSERENRFFAAGRAWQSIAEPCASALNHIVGSRLTIDRYAGQRHYLTVPMQQNRVTVKAVEAMWSAISEFKDVVASYLKAKQQLLGLDELRWYDLQAPLTQQGAKIEYEAGCQTILEAFSGFHPPMSQFAEQAFREGWIEAEDRPGKRQGGFCTDFPRSAQTRIFMTYHNTEDSLSTLAHELGHAYHSWQLKDRPHVAQRYPMTLAEMASTFAETVLAERRLLQTNDPRGQLERLDLMLNDAVAFLMNIHCRWLFDNDLHTRRAEGELPAEELSAMMVQAQKTAYHHTLADDGYNPTFWISKLHFYISDEPFYNFPYTFGYLLSQRLYLEAAQDMQSFPARYDAFLEKTADASAISAARDSFSFDLESEAFWTEAMQPIRERAEKFTQLAGEARG
ncbi:M3 family oligoendopeptidase [Rubinisphaera sp. JC750]|uniref:M3 family oligoendopeptidase n=1 Tax=Rubinisphaera sp. JC750 TaxID=2898658 RepID=UPI001F30072C|nr:M3 family oligoendopeptidase [Rubinisphaera sp. JC750]